MTFRLEYDINNNFKLIVHFYEIYIFETCDLRLI